MSCSLPFVFTATKGKCMLPDKTTVRVQESSMTAVGVWQSISLTAHGRSVVEDVNTWIQTFSHIYPCTHTHARTHVDTHTRTYPIQYSSRHKRGKTCRHGCLSKQLQQTETKLNLKPRATPATECLWQIWQGRKGSAAGPKGGRHDEENARCGSERKRKLLG